MNEQMNAQDTITNTLIELIVDEWMNTNGDWIRQTFPMETNSDYTNLRELLVSAIVTYVQETGNAPNRNCLVSTISKMLERESRGRH